MSTNFYFNNYQASQEQQLIEDLIVESIKIYGQDMFYLPRTLVNKDNLYQESTIIEYNNALEIEAYIKNVNGFAGQGDFLSKFNLEIRDQVTITISRRSFYNEVATIAGIQRPNEGDLIYFPLNRKMFVIKFVEHEAIFYQLGSLQTFDLTCELYEYSSEIFNTGMEFIDNTYRNYSKDAYHFALKTEDNEYLMQETDEVLTREIFDRINVTELDNNKVIQSESDNVIDFSEKDPFSANGSY